MKFGLKLWSINEDVLPQAENMIKENIFNYVELTPIPASGIEPFLSYDFPYTIHITTERYGLNIADKRIRDFNLGLIENCINWADQLKAIYLILHPGFGLLDDTIDFLSYIDDRRVLIENMPKIGMNDENMIGYSPEQIKQLIGEDFGFCLDFNHAIKAAISLELDYRNYVHQFIKLKPFYFHISDGNLKHGKDEHLSIGEGDYDFDFLTRCINSNSEHFITLETPRINLMSLEEDFHNLQTIYPYIIKKTL